MRVLNSYLRVVEFLARREAHSPAPPTLDFAGAQGRDGTRQTDQYFTVSQS